MTAEEYAFENMQGCDLDEIVSALEGFAKLKCEKLLEIIVENAKIIENRSMSSGYDYTERYVCKDSIINAVDLNEFIK